MRGVGGLRAQGSQGRKFTAVTDQKPQLRWCVESLIISIKYATDMKFGTWPGFCRLLQPVICACLERAWVPVSDKWHKF